MKLITSLMAVALVAGLSTANAGPIRSGVQGTHAPTSSPERPAPTHPHPAGPLALYDADGDGTITSEEFAAAGATMVQELQSRLLTKFDADQDGKISSDESLAVHQAAAEEWLEQLLTRYDRDGDGAIGPSDFPRTHRGARRPPHLAAHDTNGDGILSSEELIAAAESFANSLQERFLSHFDADADGEISAEESLAVHQAAVDERIAAVLARFDLDKDGNVTRAEIASVLQPRRPKPPIRR